MRLFVAFVVPSAPLLPLCEKLTFEGVKVVKEFHCTMKFLGEVAEERAEKIITCLRRVSFSSFRAHFSDVGAFPTLNNIRVVWVGLKPEEKILALQQQVDDALKTMFPLEERFVPHVTLARVKYLRDRDSFKKIVHQLHVEKKEFVVGEFILFKSELRRTGPVYTAVERFVFTT